MWKASSKCCSNLIYTFAGRLWPRLPRAINLNWISEKRISLVQFKRQSLCYYNFNFLKLRLFTRHSLPSTLSSVSRFQSFFSPRAHVYLHPHALAGGCTRKRTVTRIVTAGCRWFNYDFSYFSKDYLELFIGCCLVLNALIAGKRSKWQCIKIF